MAASSCPLRTTEEDPTTQEVTASQAVAKEISMVATVVATFLFFHSTRTKRWGKKPNRTALSCCFPSKNSAQSSSTDRDRRFDPSLNLSVPDEAGLGPVNEVHAVGRVVLPSDFIGVVPQGSDLEYTNKQTDRQTGVGVEK